MQISSNAHCYYRTKYFSEIVLLAFGVIILLLYIGTISFRNKLHHIPYKIKHLFLSNVRMSRYCRPIILLYFTFS